MDADGETITGGRLVTRELAEWVAGPEFSKTFLSPPSKKPGGYWPTTWVSALSRRGHQTLGPVDHPVLRRSRRRSTRSHDHRHGEEDACLEGGPRKRHYGARLRICRFSWIRPALSVCGDCTPRPGRGSSTLGPGARSLHRHRVRGDQSDHQGDPRGRWVPVLRTGALWHIRGCGRLCLICPGLSALFTNYALGLAAAFTGGTFQGHEEGAGQRSLNGGMASERGVTVAELAETGFRATELGARGNTGLRQDVLRRPLGCRCLARRPGRSFEITRRWAKANPMNLTLHAPVEALLKIMRENDLQHTDIEQIDAAWQKVEPFLAKHKVSTVVSSGEPAVRPFRGRRSGPYHG